MRGEYLDRMSGNPGAGRTAAYLAALDVAAGLAHEASSSWDHREVLSSLTSELLTGASEADQAREALAHVVSWAHGHPFQDAAKATGFLNGLAETAGI